MSTTLAPIEEAEDRPRAIVPTRGTTLSTKLRKLTRPGNLIVLGAQIGVVVALVVGWAVFAGPPGEPFVVVDEFFVGQPGEAWSAIVTWLGDGTLATHATVTLRETIYGFVIGCGSGIAIGFALAVNEHVGRVFRPLVMAANTIPKLALVPMLIMWFGIGEPSKIATAALLVFFLVFLNTFQGVREVDPHLINALKVTGASTFMIVRRVTIPSSLVWVVSGMRISVPYAFLGAVVGEMMAAQNGLGTLIQRSSNAFQPSQMMAAIVVLIAFALTLNVLITVLERVVLRWKFL
jgi:NitT/TauT family transport system permease protein